jgi:hypothetical protein
MIGVHSAGHPDHSVIVEGKYWGKAAVGIAVAIANSELVCAG